MQFRILIVDDNPTVREQLNAILNTQKDWQVCGEAVNGREAVDRVHELHPDLVIMDFSMPVMNGLQAAQVIHADTPETPLILFSIFVSAQLVKEAQRSGFSGVVAKEHVEELTEGVDTVLKQGKYFPPGLEN